jgi:hypothetical protein
MKVVTLVIRELAVLSTQYSVLSSQFSSRTFRLDRRAEEHNSFAQESGGWNGLESREGRTNPPSG